MQATNKHRHGVKIQLLNTGASPGIMFVLFACEIVRSFSFLNHMTQETEGVGYDIGIVIISLMTIISHICG